MTRPPALAGLLALALLAPAAAVGHDEGDRKTPRVADAVAHRPTAIPDRIILTWTGDPAHSQAVTWRTDATVKRAVAQIAPADAGPKFVAKAETVEAETTPLAARLSGARPHARSRSTRA